MNQAMAVYLSGAPSWAPWLLGSASHCSAWPCCLRLIQCSPHTREGTLPHQRKSRGKSRHPRGGEVGCATIPTSSRLQRQQFGPLNVVAEQAGSSACSLGWTRFLSVHQRLEGSFLFSSSHQLISWGWSSWMFVPRCHYIKYWLQHWQTLASHDFILLLGSWSVVMPWLWASRCWGISFPTSRGVTEASTTSSPSPPSQWSRAIQERCIKKALNTSYRAQRHGWLCDVH